MVVISHSYGMVITEADPFFFISAAMAPAAILG
jgi:hypothetical protein